jgi:phage tail-like protein
MAVRTPGEYEPVPAFRFAVEIEGLVAGWFGECGGLSAERAVRTYEEGGLNAYVHQLPGRVAGARITLKKGIASPLLWRWFAGDKDEGLHEGKVAHRDVTIILLHADHSEAGRWNLPQALPVRWSGHELGAAGDRMAIQTLELAQGNAAHSSVQRAVEAEEVGAPPYRGVQQEVELPALAQRVFALLKQELRVERERLGWRR